MALRDLVNRMRTPTGHSEGAPSPRADISHLLFVTARPGAQVLWTVVAAATLIYAVVRPGPHSYWALALLVLSYLAVLLGNHYFPFDEYHPYLFFALMAAFLAFFGSVVYFTGGQSSALVFLYFILPIYAAHYYGYAGTMLVALATAVVTAIPLMTGSVTGVQVVSKSITIAAYFIVGLIACYIVESESVFARESHDFRQLLEVSRDREREVSLIYNLSRKFSYTLDLDTILKTTTALARKLLSSEGALVFLLEDGQPALKASLGLLPFADLGAVRLPDTEWRARLASGLNVVAQRVPMSWLPLQDRGRARYYSLAAVPLFAGADVMGYLLCFSSASRMFREAHLEILSTLASQAAVAVEKARLYSHTVSDKTKVETILSALRDGLLVTDSEGLLLQANPVAEHMLGIDESRLGESLTSILEGPIARADLGVYTLEEALEAALEGRTVLGEMTVAGVASVTVQAHYIPLRGHIGVNGVVLFLHDITELKRIDEMKSNFVSNVSHELRTPLTSIAGYVSLLLAGRAGRLTSQQEQYLDVVQQQTTNLTGMIEDLLDLSKLRTERFTVREDRVDLTELLESARLWYEEAAKAKGIEIALKLSDTLPPVAGEAARLSQVIANVIGNAIKYTDGGGYIEVTAHLNGRVVQVQVTDTGEGISAAALPHIFDRFFQAHAPGGEHSDSGFGLGLAISREIVEMHGGSIWVESELGRGSTFFFTVPAYKEQSVIIEEPAGGRPPSG